jgi:hypothetical protein
MNGTSLTESELSRVSDFHPTPSQMDPHDRASQAIEAINTAIQNEEIDAQNSAHTSEGGLPSLLNGSGVISVTNQGIPHLSAAFNASAVLPSLQLPQPTNILPSTNVQQDPMREALQNLVLAYQQAQNQNDLARQQNQQLLNLAISLIPTNQQQQPLLPSLPLPMPQLQLPPLSVPTRLPQPLPQAQPQEQPLIPTNQQQQPLLPSLPLPLQLPPLSVPTQLPQPQAQPPVPLLNQGSQNVAALQSLLDLLIACNQAQSQSNNGNNK